MNQLKKQVEAAKLLKSMQTIADSGIDSTLNLNQLDWDVFMTIAAKLGGRFDLKDPTQNGLEETLLVFTTKIDGLKVVCHRVMDPISFYCQESVFSGRTFFFEPKMTFTLIDNNYLAV